MNTFPSLSIAVPVYNREKLIGRCIDSVLAQSMEDYELLVFDDGSRDSSVAAIRCFNDSRIRLRIGSVNKGINSAWNSLMEMANTEWVIFMGSDDEFLPGALETIRRKTACLPKDVACARFMVRWDNGTTSPQPGYREEIWDYRGYLLHIEGLTGSSEGMTMVRTFLRNEFRYREDRSSEGLYLLNVAKAYRTATFPDFTRLYHTDAPNQSEKSTSVSEIMRRASDSANAAEAIIEIHGAFLGEIAPGFYRRFRRMAVRMNFLAGRRRIGWKMVWDLLAEKGASPMLLTEAIVGSVAPSLLAVLSSARKWLRVKRL